MTILWAEGFDHYGTSPNGGRDAMLSGAWSSFSAGNGTLPFISNIQKRTGDYSLAIDQIGGATAGAQARRVLGAGKLIFGVAYGLYLESLPANNNQYGMEIRDNTNTNIVRMAYQSDGALGFAKGGTFTAVGNSDPILTAGAWNHVEIKVIIDNVVGEIEARVNGSSVFNMTNLDIGVTLATQIAWGGLIGFATPLRHFIDDLVPWDDQGEINNDFLGQQRVNLLLPSSDTAEADWVKVGAVNGYDCIDNIPPDADTTYLSAPNVSDKSEFGLGTLPPETETIAAAYIAGMAKLEDAGLGSMQFGLVSGSDVSLGPDTALSGAYTYYGSVHELDPSLGSAWTKSGLEAAKLRIVKTA